VGIEPYVAFRHLNGDAGDLFDDGVARGIAVTLGLPMVPLRLRGGIDYSKHERASDRVAGDLDGTVLTLDAVLDLGMGIAAPYLFAGVGVSNLDDDPVPPSGNAAYDGGGAIARGGAGFRVGLGRRIAVAGEACYARGGEGNTIGAIPGAPVGNLSYIDLKAAAIISF
jgi:hypothetical protein